MAHETIITTRQRRELQAYCTECDTELDIDADDDASYGTPFEHDAIIITVKPHECEVTE